MKRILLLLGCLLVFFAAFAQSPHRWTSADMYLALRKLNVLGSVLYVAAHPDDENTRLIAYFSKDRMYRTGYLALTRGDGGQNLIGDEQGIELGLIRTQELLSARRIDGGEQFFTRAFDFGYSKSPEETFTKWDREKILSDVVWVIRKFRPDIIITRFPTTGEGGHGHHTASAILANEAFTAAADPRRFPEQLKYVQPWQAKRIMWNTFRFGSFNTTSEEQFKFDVGGYNPLLGKSYGEIAAESRSQHKSQGFGVSASRGEAMEYFKITGGAAPRKDIMDDVDVSWGRVKGGQEIAASIEALTKDFDLLHPERSVRGLVALYRKIAALPEGYWRNQKLKETKELIEQCSGLFLEATTNRHYAVRTDSVQVVFSLNNQLGVQAVLQEVRMDAFDSVLVQPLPNNRNLNISRTFYVPVSKPVTQPYWLEQPMQEGYYTVTDQQLIGIPDIQPAYTATFRVAIDGQELLFTQPVKYKHTDPVRGELYEPLVVIPSITVGNVAPFYLRNMGQSAIDVVIKGNTDVSWSGSLATASGGTAAHSYDTLSLLINSYHLNKGETATLPFSLDNLGDNTYKVCVAPDTEHARLMQQNISYTHIPDITWFRKAITSVKTLDLTTYGKKIGYITGAGDKVPEALEQMGYEVTILDDRRLSANNLQQFDAIITGVRAYNTNDWMDKHYTKLMQYVENGGNLVVQYNTSNFISSVEARVGPFPFTISRNRVTDEKAVVSFVQPDHPVLNFPNKITPEDFVGWIQERSIYDAVNWDSHFQPVLSMHDPGEDADKGSLIVAPYGKGVFVYTGLVFFRELPAGVPGAYRLLANIIALNRKKGF